MSSQPARKTAAKRPDDTPFDFNLDALQPEKDLRPFVVHWQGRRWEMKHLDELDVWGVVEAAAGGEITAMTGAFRMALGDQWEAFRKTNFPQWQFKRLFNAYREFCGLNADGTPIEP